jgi:LacI family repressor for deo operon, udp, cdd, tsx, nupC, and nupG
MHPVFAQLTVNPNKGYSLSMQLKMQLTWLIASAQLKPGDRLPTVRQMADHLSINLHTVRSAYHMLEAEGLLETRRGKGTHVLPFTPSQIIQSQPMQRSHCVGVIVPSWSNPFYHAFLQGVEEIAQEDQILLFLCITHDDPGAVIRIYAQLAAKRVDGILVVSHEPSDLSLQENWTNQIPCVTSDWPARTGYSVQLDLEGAGYQATRHLIEHGHRRLGLVTFRESVPNVQPDNNGYRRALQEAGIKVETDLITRAPDFTPASGEEAARQLLTLPQRPTAIFAIADMLALGVMQAIRSAGLHIPEEIALTSFNDIPFAGFVDPPLTTVAAPAVQMGQEAMRMLRNLIAGKRPAHKHVVLPTSLVVRQSCGQHAQLDNSFT